MSGRKNSKKKKKSIKAWALSLAALLLLISQASFAQSQIKQYQKHTKIGGSLDTTILIVGWTADDASIHRLLELLVTKSTEAFNLLNWQNPYGETAKVNANAGNGPVVVSGITLGAFQAYKKIAEWTSGNFDLNYGNAGSYRDVKINDRKSTIELKKSGMQIRFDNMLEGFLADLIIRYIHSANMNSAMAKVGNIFRGMGSSMHGPWRIQVEDDAGMFAHHALKLTVKNTGIATISGNQFRSKPLINPQTKQTMAPTCKGTTVVMNEAAFAQGLAFAVFVLGPEKGMKLLKKYGKGLIVDNQGKFLRSPGF